MTDAVAEAVAGLSALTEFETIIAPVMHIIIVRLLMIRLLFFDNNFIIMFDLLDIKTVALYLCLI